MYLQKTGRKNSTRKLTVLPCVKLLSNTDPNKKKCIPYTVQYVSVTCPSLNGESNRTEDGAVISDADVFSFFIFTFCQPIRIIKNNLQKARETRCTSRGKPVAKTGDDETPENVADFPSFKSRFDQLGVPLETSWAPFQKLAATLASRLFSIPSNYTKKEQRDSIGAGM